jgi:phosphoglycolate phosphatase-like HAD superfamily hydrolase
MLRRYVEMDEQMVEEGGDRSQSIYGMQVRNIASLVERFTRITEKLAEINERAEEVGEEFERVREHNMGTHGSVMESFLVEVVKRTLGEQEKEKLLTVIPNGVAVSEGTTITIETLENKQTNILFSFSVARDSHDYTYNATVPRKIIEEIIQDFSPKDMPKKDE